MLFQLLCSHTGVGPLVLLQESGANKHALSSQSDEYNPIAFTWMVVNPHLFHTLKNNLSSLSKSWIDINSMDILPLYHISIHHVLSKNRGLLISGSLTQTEILISISFDYIWVVNMHLLIKGSSYIPQFGVWFLKYYCYLSFKCLSLWISFHY